jgi:spore coat polysaccharide biosynthesis protein SpsF
MLDRVINSALKCQSFLNNPRNHNKRGDSLRVEVALLIPENDPLEKIYIRRKGIDIVTGSEDDVLSRYMQLNEAYGPVDHVVRLTSDCPLIPAFIISKHITKALNFDYDYVSNVDERCRTAPDGWDCEVISERLLNWTDENAKSETDREHVTTVIRRETPSWANVAHIVNYCDQSHLKLSVDTQEDLEFVRTYNDILNRKLNAAKNSAGGLFRC